MKGKSSLFILVMVWIMALVAIFGFIFIKSSYDNAVEFYYDSDIVKGLSYSSAHDYAMQDRVEYYAPIFLAIEAGLGLILFVGIKINKKMEG